MVRGDDEQKDQDAEQYAKKMHEETDQRIAAIREQFKKNKDQVADLLLHKATSVDVEVNDHVRQALKKFMGV